MLAAVIYSLCSHHIRLRSALPNLCDLQESLHVRRSYRSLEIEGTSSLNSPSENGSSSPTFPQIDVYQYPILVKLMVYFAFFSYTSLHFMNYSLRSRASL